MELKEYWKIIRRWWWLIALPVVVVAAYLSVSYKPPPPVVYTTTLRITAAQPATSESGRLGYYDPNYFRWLTSEYIAGAIKDWSKTGEFAKAVSEELAAQGVAIPPEAVQGSIASDSIRSVVTLYLTWPEAGGLEAMGKAVITVLQERSVTTFPQLGGQETIIVPLDAPVAVPTAPPLRSRFDMPLKLGLSLAAGALLALLAHYLDPRVRDAADVEQAGLRVVAAIPRTWRPRGRRR